MLTNRESSRLLIVVIDGGKCMGNIYPEQKVHSASRKVSRKTHTGDSKSQARTAVNWSTQQCLSLWPGSVQSIPGTMLWDYYTRHKLHRTAAAPSRGSVCIPRLWWPRKGCFVIYSRDESLLLLLLPAAACSVGYLLSTVGCVIKCFWLVNNLLILTARQHVSSG